MQINIFLVLLIPQITISSPDQRFSAEVEYYPGTELVSRTLTMKKDDVILYTLNSPRAASFFINNQGNSFGVGLDALYFYNNKGDEILIQMLNAPNGFMFSPDHSMFFASDLNGLNVYDQNGSIKYTFPACRLFAGSDRGDIVATVNDEYLSVYLNGKEIYSETLANPYVWSIAIDEDKNTIQLQLPTSTEEYKYDIEEGER